MSFPVISIFICLGILSCVLLFSFSLGVFPFTTDSIIYITTAERVSAHHGLTHVNLFTHPASPDFLPSILQPPGFPLLISLFHSLGFSAYTVGVFLPRLCFLFLPLLFFMVFRKMMSLTPALIAAFVCSFMFSVIKCSLLVWSDVPYLLFCLISFVMAFRIIERKGQIHILFILLAGVMAGYAFLIRYIGLTLIVSIVLGFALCILFKIMSFKKFSKVLFFYSLGAAFVGMPFMLRNKIVFKTFQPYQLPHSIVPWQDNVRDYFQGLAEMIFAHYSFDKGVVILILLLGLFFVLQIKSGLQHNQQACVFVFILASYFVFNSVFLIAFKTVYFAPEKINERYLIQVAWILMGGLVYVIDTGLKKFSVDGRTSIKSITTLLIMAFLFIQIFPASDFYFFQKRIKNLSKEIQQYAPLLRLVPPDHVIVSNIAEITYYISQRNVRMLNGYTPYGLVTTLGLKRKFVVFLVKENEPLSDAWVFDKSWYMHDGYASIYFHGNVELLTPLTVDQARVLRFF